MKNQFSEGNAVEIPSAPYAVVSGAGCLQGALFGVASFTAAISTPVTLYTRGAYQLAAVALQAWTVGQLIYWDDAAKLCTNVPGALKVIGVALAVKTNNAASTTGFVRLNGTSYNTV